MEGGTRLKRSHTTAQTAASAVKHTKVVAAVAARKRRRAVRYVETPQQRAATGTALARLLTVGEVLMDRLSDGREWRDGSHKVKRPRRKEGKGDG